MHGSKADEFDADDKLKIWQQIASDPCTYPWGFVPYVSLMLYDSDSHSWKSGWLGTTFTLAIPHLFLHSMKVLVLYPTRGGNDPFLRLLISPDRGALHSISNLTASVTSPLNDFKYHHNLDVAELGVITVDKVWSNISLFKLLLG
jgi:hypothetical protein